MHLATQIPKGIHKPRRVHKFGEVTNQLVNRAVINPNEYGLPKQGDENVGVIKVIAGSKPMDIHFTLPFLLYSINMWLPLTRNCFRNVFALFRACLINFFSSQKLFSF